jgi:uncharacterized membrane protein YkgB
MVVQDRTENQVSPLLPPALIALELRVLAFLNRASLPLLRLSIALVFIWFGALKITRTSPVGELVAATIPFLDPGWFVPALGFVEVLLGLGLLVRWPLRLVIPTLVAHLAGTFLVLLARPDLAFQHGNPLMLTTIGEFVVKNLVLIAGGLVLASRLTARNSSATAGRVCGGRRQCAHAAGEEIAGRQLSGWAPNDRIRR